MMAIIRGVLNRSTVLIIMASLTGVALALSVAMGDNSKNEEKENMSPIAKLQSKNASMRDKAVDAFLKDRKNSINDLVALVAQTGGKKYSDETRSAAAYLLGEMRAPEAVPALSRASANPLGPMDSADTSRYDAPIFTALVKIGRPAVPAMIKNLEETDNAILRMRSTVVLYHVLGGKQHLLELLGKLKARTKDKAVAKRIEAVTVYVQKNFKETTAPLY